MLEKSYVKTGTLVVSELLMNALWQFLDFSNMSEWTQGFIKSIEPIEPKSGTMIEKGDKLKVVLDGATFNPTVLVCFDLTQCDSSILEKEY